VGSDLDLVVILDTVDEPFGQRSLPEDVFSIPVPVDVLVYSGEEWQGLVAAGGKFIDTLQAETVWVYKK
jgi:hypothetical protein